MKDIKSYVIGLLTCGYLFGGIFDNVENPNGKPFTLGIEWAYEHYEPSGKSLKVDTDGYAGMFFADELISIAPAGYSNTRWKLLLPVSFWLTLTYEQYLDRGGIYFSDFSYTRYKVDSGTVVSLGAELHLPLYKLWKR